MTSKARTHATKSKASRGSRDHIFVSQESAHDMYQIREKLPEPTVCPDCGLVFRKGRWTQGARPDRAHEHRCPACSRTRDKYPAGSITISGPFAGSHRAEVLGLARNEEAAERSEHPLARIMAVEEHADHVTITTTDLHLPRRIGEALHRAYDGELTINQEKKSYLVRVTWSR